jgi:hypothetical protein
MTGLALAAFLASLPQTQDLEPPAAGLQGPSSTRLALPVELRFDDTLTDDVTQLVKQSTGSAEPGQATREPVWAVARFGPAVARRHFEEAKWGDKKAERSIVIKSVSCTWTEGPHYQVKVVVDRYENGHRIGQSTGTGYAMADRTAQRTGAAYAGPFGIAMRHDANQPKPEDDGQVIRQATVAALDSALMQLAAVWSGEQMVAKARQDAEAAMKRARKK